ncbi:hypothetical protein CEN45_21295 [Fischerella thermalis CCMEE 5198]|nr:hypothetical protein CI594_10990 [Fischerella thermalis CCMEE 5196]PMB18081.1 hypothetical protein CEN45_21295 [Fischerella thermalis CCMEE 5198]
MTRFSNAEKFNVYNRRLKILRENGETKENTLPQNSLVVDNSDNQNDTSKLKIAQLLKKPRYLCSRLIQLNYLLHTYIKI